MFCTCPNEESARAITHALLEQGLAACVNHMSNVTSNYRWQGKIEQANEYLLMIKTQKNCFEKLQKTVKEIHPYDVPEIIGCSIDIGSIDYLKWIEDETKF